MPINHNPPAEYQEYKCGGGYTDKDGITWGNRGTFFLPKNSTEDKIINSQSKHCSYYPFIQKVNWTGNQDMPPKNTLSNEALEDYERIMRDKK